MRSKIQEHKFQDRFISVSREGQEVDSSWLEGAEQMAQAGVLDAVIASENPRSTHFVLIAGQFDPEIDLYRAVTNQRVSKTPFELFPFIRPVIRYAKTIHFVDPYLQSTGIAADSFRDLIDLTLSEVRAHGRTGAKIYCHLSKPAEFQPHVQQINFARLLDPLLSPGESITLQFWQSRDGDRLHDRHLITDRAALTSTYGWCRDAGDEITTDVSIKNPETHSYLLNCFSKGMSGFGVLTADATIEIANTDF